MGADWFPIGRVLGFLLVLARVAGVFVFVPLPGAGSSPVIARVGLSLGITFCLMPMWPTVPGLEQSVARLAGLIIIDSAVGMVLGLTVAFAMEAMKLAGQIAGLQAGFGYAATIDPASGVDSSLLLVIAELFGGMLFFAAGLDRQILAVMAGTLKTLPPGDPVQLHGAPQILARLGGDLFGYGLRLAFPVLAFLILVDLTLGFLGRVSAQLQLLTLAFPIKIIAAIALFAVLAPVYARVYQAYAQQTMEAGARILLHP